MPEVGLLPDRSRPATCASPLGYVDRTTLTTRPRPTHRPHRRRHAPRHGVDRAYVDKSHRPSTARPLRRRSERRYREGVTRIIAGRAGSLSLEVPDAGTRPDERSRARVAVRRARVRRCSCAERAVLDLYAGSGALGLEALSRGAASRRSRREGAARGSRRRSAMRRGSRKAVGRGRAIAVHRASADAFLHVAARPVRPRVHRPAVRSARRGSDARASPLLVPSLAAGATVIVERASRSAEPRCPTGSAARSGQALRRHDAVVGRRRALDRGQPARVPVAIGIPAAAAAVRRAVDQHGPSPRAGTAPIGRNPSGSAAPAREGREQRVVLAARERRRAVAAERRDLDGER